MVQQQMGGGDQSNETSAENLKDDAIADQIRSQWKSKTGSDFPISDGMGASNNSNSNQNQGGNNNGNN